LERNAAAHHHRFHSTCCDWLVAFGDILFCCAGLLCWFIFKETWDVVALLGRLFGDEETRGWTEETGDISAACVFFSCLIRWSLRPNRWLQKKHWKKIMKMFYLLATGFFGRNEFFTIEFFQKLVKQGLPKNMFTNAISLKIGGVGSANTFFGRMLVWKLYLEKSRSWKPRNVLFWCSYLKLAIPCMDNIMPFQIFACWKLLWTLGALELSLWQISFGFCRDWGWGTGLSHL